MNEQGKSKSNVQQFICTGDNPEVLTCVSISNYNNTSYENLQYGRELVQNNRLQNQEDYEEYHGPIIKACGCDADVVCLPPLNGMVGWWNADNNARDSVNGNNGIYHGDYTVGVSGEAFAIQGGDDVVTVDESLPNFYKLESSRISVSAWVKSFQPNDYKWIVAKGANACLSASYGLYAGPVVDNVRFIVYDGNTVGLASANVPGIWNNTWHNVIGTYDGVAIKLYVDGVLVATTNYSLPINYNLPTNNDLTIGRYTGCVNDLTNNYSFPGDIDEVTIYNRSLSPVEIGKISASQFCKCKNFKPHKPRSHSRSCSSSSSSNSSCSTSSSSCDICEKSSSTSTRSCNADGCNL